MSLHDRIEALREKHASLERAIDEEIHRPLPNQETVHDLEASETPHQGRNLPIGAAVAAPRKQHR